ncbi:FdhF/YdeP family oxidoreductase [Aquimarina sp. U1-2]|uniref:FdhF/YdeP family oxidoreductase n=1 Tax=Aquimarina sp. U1-2 TaxID=2823141 RepID=UPI001AEC7FAA|nr:FdhF/YdeP family oxidoreductase [Aquimarina sp. U1-2]MBP2831017.1 FdhF/YdeP family oxidoreductase [Aquimarina sp. U1-2]
MKKVEDIETKVNHLTSQKLTGIQLKEPKTKAAGIPAVMSSLRHGHEEMGLSKTFKTLLKLNQTDGFDCPGCAWPDPNPKDRSKVAEYCENGAKAVAEEATKKVLDTAFFKKHSVEKLSHWSDYEIGKSGRIIEPMILREGQSHYEPISWSDAFETIGKTLNSLNSPDEAVFYTSGRTSNEAAFSYQLFARDFGTNNLPDCSNMCHESSGTALSQTLGTGKGSVTLKDFEKAELIFVVGQNPGTNHPRMLSALVKAKSKGAKIISVNPLKETGLINFVDPQDPIAVLTGGKPISDIFLQVKINQDVALFKAILKILWDEEKANPGSIFNLDFIEKETAGYEDFIYDLDGQDLKDLMVQTGIPTHQIHEVAEYVKHSNRIIICWAMGLTQHKNSVMAISEVVNLLLLKGSVGIEGGGTCPVRGHSNVQGDRTVGIWEKPPAHIITGLNTRFGIDVPTKHGYDVVSTIKGMHKGKAKVFFGMGGNFVSATPDTTYTAEALQKCELTVHVSTKLNRSHLVHGKTAIILPTRGRTEKDVHDGKEQFVTVENSMGIVHKSLGLNKPISDNLLSETQIVCRMAKATLPNSLVDYTAMEQDYDVIRDHIEAVIPGFDDYNTRVRKTGGFYLPNCNREGKWNTANGKANFTINKQTQHKLAEDELMMMTLRSHDQYNTTIYGLHDRYRGIFNERRIIMMNVKDIAKFGLQQGDVVDLSSNFNGVLREEPTFIVVEYDIPQGCVGTYFPEANSLVPIDSVAEKSNTPTSKSVIIKLKKTERKVVF